MPISEKDQMFINDLLADELEDGMMETLDIKLKNPEFKLAYEKALDIKYRRRNNSVMSYLPMVILLILIIIGLYLIIV